MPGKKPAKNTPSGEKSQGKRPVRIRPARKRLAGKIPVTDGHSQNGSFLYGEPGTIYTSDRAGLFVLTRRTGLFLAVNLAWFIPRKRQRLDYELYVRPLCNALIWYVVQLVSRKIASKHVRAPNLDPGIRLIALGKKHCSTRRNNFWSIE